MLLFLFIFSFQNLTHLHLPEFTTRNVQLATPKYMVRSAIARSDTVVDVKDGGRDENGGADDVEETDHNESDILFHYKTLKL